MPRVARLSRQEFDSAQLRSRSQMPGYRSRSRPPSMLGTPRSRSYSLGVIAPQGWACVSSSGSAHRSSRTRRPALLRTYWLHPLARGQAVAVLPATTSRSGKNRVVCAQGLNLLCEGLPSMRVHYVRAETALRNRARRVSFPKEMGWNPARHLAQAFHLLPSEVCHVLALVKARIRSSFSSSAAIRSPTPQGRLCSYSGTVAAFGDTHKAQLA